MGAEARVDSYTMPLDAELAKAYLESYSIRVRLDGETLGGTAYALGPMMGGIRLYVEEHEERRARALLDEYHRALHERRSISYGDADGDDEFGELRGNAALELDADPRASGAFASCAGPQARAEADEEATHAWVMALAGLVVFPVFTHCYSIACLLRVPYSALTSRGTKRYVTAWVIDATVLIAAAWVLWRWLDKA